MFRVSTGQDLDNEDKDEITNKQTDLNGVNDRVRQVKEKIAGLNVAVEELKGVVDRKSK